MDCVQIEDSRAYVHYTFWESRFDEWIPLNSPRIAPHGTHIFQTGGILRTGQKIDVFDTHPQLFRWLEGKIVDERDTDVKVHFRGYAASLDEWLPRDATFRDPQTHRITSRFAPFGHRSKHPRPYRPPQYFYWRNRERRRALSAASAAFTAYKHALKTQELRIVMVEGDGNCMFRSVSHQVYGSDEHHALLRKYTADYMTEERAYFSGWVADDFSEYIQRLRQNGTWGDDPELQALSELYDRPIEVWMYDQQQGAKVLKRLHQAREGVSPIRLSYYGGGHYDSLVGPGHGEGIISTPPGQREEGMLRAVRLRNTPQGRAGLATAEDSELQTVVAASRLAYAEQDSSIEAALRASLQELSPGAAADGGDADVTAATVQASEVDATDSELLRSVQADTEAAATQEAILAHLQAEAKRKEEADLAAAIAASQGASTQSSAASQAAHGGQGSRGGATPADDEDAMLAAALAASMHDTPTTGAQSSVGPQPAAGMDDDEMLQAALALSMDGMGNVSPQD